MRMFDIAKRILDSVPHVIGDACPPPIQSRPYYGGPDIEYVTVNFPNAANANVVDRDILVQFQRPWHFFWVSSITNVARGVNLYLHFVALGLTTQVPGNTIAEAGTEKWITLNNAAITGAVQSAEGRILKLKVPAKAFYIDGDHPYGVTVGGYFVTFGGTDDIIHLHSGLG